LARPERFWWTRLVFLVVGIASPGGAVAPRSSSSVRFSPLSEAWKAYRSGRHKRVIRLLVGRTFSRTQAVEARFLFGLCFYGQGEFATASGFSKTQPAVLAKGLLSWPPGSRPAASRSAPALSVCVAHYQSRRYEKAAACFSARLKAYGSKPGVLFALGYTRYQQGRYDRAASLFAAVSLMIPADGDALFMQGMSAFRLGQYNKARGFFARALSLGLSNEDPKEARKYRDKAKEILKKKAKRVTGWHVRLDVSGGYDSHPRLFGIAAESYTSAFSNSQGSGIATLAATGGYRFPMGARFLGDFEYAFSQLLVFSDVESTTGSTHQRSGRDEESTSLSLQSHSFRFTSLYSRSRLSLALASEAFADMAGLRPLTPMTGGGGLGAKVAYRWAFFTRSSLLFRYTAQRGLDETFAYLSGQGLSVKLGQALWWSRWLHVEPSYRFAAWWLGTLATDTADCPSGEACVLEFDYSGHIHEAALSVASRPLSWLSLDAVFAFQHRRFLNPGIYRFPTSGDVSVLRKDLFERLRLKVSFHTSRHTRLGLCYIFEHNDSTVDAETTGIEEGYSRHVVEGSFSYVR